MSRCRHLYARPKVSRSKEALYSILVICAWDIGIVVMIAFVCNKLLVHFTPNGSRIPHYLPIKTNGIQEAGTFIWHLVTFVECALMAYPNSKLGILIISLRNLGVAVVLIFVGN